MPKTLDFKTIKTLLMWFKGLGFTKDGIKLWFDKYALNEKIPDLENAVALGNFTLYQAWRISIYHHPPNNKRYISKELEKMADYHVRDDLSWLSGTGRYRQ